MVTPGAAPAGLAPSASRLRVAGRFAYAAGAGELVNLALLIGFFALELQTSDDAPLGTASDPGTATTGLLIPAALALGACLPARRCARIIQRAGITAMAVTAASGSLMVIGLLSYDVETPLSSVTSLLVVGWLAAVSWMLRTAGPFRPRVTRLGPAIGLALLAGLILLLAGLPFARLSLPQVIISGSGVAIGGTAWSLSAVWDLSPGQDLARAAGADGVAPTDGAVHADTADRLTGPGRPGPAQPEAGSPAAKPGPETTGLATRQPGDLIPR